MPRLLIAVFCLTAGSAAASSPANVSRELVHPYPPTGPIEIAGTAPAGKVLRTLQRYSVPAFTDVLAAHVGHTLQGPSDAPVAVTRKSRQGGNEAFVAVSSAAADGRTLLLASRVPSPATAVAAGGLRPVALVASMPFVIVAGGVPKPATLGELIDQTRRASKNHFVASAGERSTAHVGIELLRTRYGLRLEPVAYNGANAAIQAILTRQIETALVPLPAALPYLSGGGLRALAVTDAQRHPRIAHVQTAGEAGLAGFETAGWFGVFAPAATSQTVVRDLNALLARGPEAGDTRQAFFDLGLRLEHRAADAFDALLARERQRNASG